MTDTKPIILPKLQETLASLISRFATHYWVDAPTFCADKGVSFKAVLQQSEGTVDHLRAYGVDIPETVLDWSPRALSGKKYSFRNHEFPTKILKSPEVRGCPECLRNDLESGANQMALRGNWHVPHVTICMRHKTPLVPLWREGNQTRRYDSAPRLNSLIPRLCNGELNAEPRKVLEFDLWLHSRLVGSKSTDNWLDQHSVHAACNFCRYLGTALLRLENIPLTRVMKQDYPLLYEMGFQVARKGKEAILNSFEAIQRKPGSPQDGAKAIFPLLYERLAYDHQNDPTYSQFQDLLRHHMAATWPLGPGDELLGEPVAVRRLHSVRTASLLCGIDQRRMRKVLAAKQLVPAPGHGLPDTWEVFDAAKAAPVLNEVSQLISAKEMASSINATRSQFDLLVADKVLSPALNDKNIKSVWNPADGQAFLDSLLHGAIQLRQAQHGWEHISKAAQRLKIRPGEIIAAIRSGEIRRVGNRMGWEGYKSIHAYHDDVAAALRPILSEAKSIEVFAKSVGIHQPSKLKLMIGDGHVQTSVLTNPITKKRQIYFTPDDEDTFHSLFLTPKTLALEFGEASRMIIRKLRQADIEPVSAHDLRYGNVYSREEIENVLK